MDILTIFSSAVPGILGLSSLLVSWRQYATTKEQVRIELFDKRYKVYSAARRFASKALLENKVENTDFNEFLRDTSESTFLFPDAIQDLLKSLKNTAINQMKYGIKSDYLVSKTGKSEELSQLIDAKERERQKLIDYLEDLDNKFMPFLDFRGFRINQIRSIQALGRQTNMLFLKGRKTND